MRRASKRLTMYKNLTTVCAAVVLAFGLAACGGGDDDGTVTIQPVPKTPYQMAVDAIAAADTEAGAQAAYDAVKDDVTAAQGEMLQMRVDERIAAIKKADRVAEQKMALMTAAGMIDTSDLSTQALVDAARMAIANLRQVLADAADVSAADKAMYMTRLDNAVDAVDMAQGGINTATRRSNQMMALSDASGTLQAALAALSGATPTQALLDAANTARTALNNALTGAADLTETEKAPYQREADNAAAPIQMAQTAFDDAEDKAADAMKAAMAKTGKALHAALEGPDATPANPLTNIAAPTLGTTLDIDATAGAGALEDAGDPGVVNLAAGDSVGMLGGWMGMDYAHMETSTKIKNAARVYTNKGAADTEPFSGADGKYTLITTAGPTEGYVLLGEAATPVTRARADAFTHSGTQNHQVPSQSDAFYVRGTYDGAPGQFRCASGCASTNDGKAGPSTLGGDWHFKPDAGAMVSQPDAHYLYYGWWVSKDKDGGPTAASAFAGRAGTDPGDSTDGLDTGVGGATLTGSATYAGHAAGKFAMSNPLTATGDGGHFTADATLTAKFGDPNNVTGSGMTGMIDNFRLNDGSEDPGWSVSLARGAWGADGAITTPAASTTGPTVWSIDGNKAPASGTWSGQMYDEMPGDAPDGDGSNIPTTVTGTFYSEFGDIGRMVGAFGADKQ